MQHVEDAEVALGSEMWKSQNENGAEVAFEGEL